MNAKEDREAEQIARDLCKKAYEAWTKGNTLDALQHYEEALEIFQQLGSLPDMANVLEKLGDIYHLRQKYDHALKAYKACLDICENFDDEISTSIIAEKISFVYREKGDYERMLPYLYRILEIAEKYRDPHRAGRALAGLGDVYTFKGNYHSAKEAYELALKIFKGMGAIEQTKLLESALRNIEEIEMTNG
ncbi:MAG: tetratricopeptide repeat protein [Caldimicrobium sp.]|nr:tetratricopeptide repeat protein [Caldimicrobium sp.]MCX7612869.1 tetratricopeptide repeat protein [Caldimicrobium sp.]MDW8183603.1 tetratricopeptide repeat protein [Caldimicrobium sp.]